MGGRNPKFAFGGLRESTGVPTTERGHKVTCAVSTTNALPRGEGGGNYQLVTDSDEGVTKMSGGGGAMGESGKVVVVNRRNRWYRSPGKLKGPSPDPTWTGLSPFIEHKKNQHIPTQIMVIIPNSKYGHNVCATGLGAPQDEQDRLTKCNEASGATTCIARCALLLSF